MQCAGRGTPEKLYDTLSSFSNQVGGGIILFGIDEKNNFEITGVYDAQDLQAKVAAVSYTHLYAPLEATITGENCPEDRMGNQLILSLIHIYVLNSQI